MKGKMANKEAKVWFMEAQKWTQHLPQEEVIACPHAKKMSLSYVTALLLLLLPATRFPHLPELYEEPSSFGILLRWHLFVEATYMSA